MAEYISHTVFRLVKEWGGGRHLRPSRPPGGDRPPAGGRDLLGTPKTVPGVSAGPQNHKPFGDEAGWQPLRPRLAGFRVPALPGQVERGPAGLGRGAVGRAAREERLAGTPRLSAGPRQPPNSTPYFRETLGGSLSAVSRPMFAIKDSFCTLVLEICIFERLCPACVARFQHLGDHGIQNGFQVSCSNVACSAGNFSRRTSCRAEK